MLSRRKFISFAGAATLGGLALSQKSLAFFNDRRSSPRPHAIGLQLFTLFPIMDEDPRGYLKKVADIGYTEIESAYSKLPGFYGMKPKEFAALCKELGMTWKSNQVLGAPLQMPK